jgi:hypothetical protein
MVRRVAVALNVVLGILGFLLWEKCKRGLS